ncbi:Cof-type HAD-IIB family hydrolase [Lentibacillus sediminis]|uniref:Cof-type HAD-IIB family hydrolase n=1 Tax=Lentibacillus sediminis TaxID=1940529 RepID=UPI000C1C7CC3|nr:Cof-type HAD-IIB family hydrolase [Lentibacillus sediminis]
MTKKLIFFDIDGTLYDDEKQLPASSKAAVRQLQEEGHHVAFATGRSPFTFEKLLEELEIDSFVSFNGQYVVHQNEVIYKNALDPDALRQLNAVAARNEHPLVYMNQQHWRSNIEYHAHIDEAVRSLKVDQEVEFDPSFHEGKEIYQTLLFCEGDWETSYAEQFNRFEFIRWHKYSVDVLPAGGSKAKGIDELRQHLGVDPENVYAFGDGLNDIQMLKSVENSIAMGNAADVVKQAAKYVTKNVSDNGIEHGLQLVGLLK